MPGEASLGHFMVLYFAAASTFTHRSSQEFTAPLKLSELFDLLEELYPGMRKSVLSTSALTINLEYIDLEDVSAGMAPDPTINEGDEIAIIPPVSSG